MEQVLRQKDIILVPFAFSNQSDSQVRPVLVISSDKFNANSLDLVAVGITSNPDIDGIIPIKPEDWKDGVYSESYIRVSNVSTVEKKIVHKRIGKLSNERFRDVMERFYGLFK